MEYQRITKAALADHFTRCRFQYAVVAILVFVFSVGMVSVTRNNTPKHLRVNIRLCDGGVMLQSSARPLQQDLAAKLPGLKRIDLQVQTITGLPGNADEPAKPGSFDPLQVMTADNNWMLQGALGQGLTPGYADLLLIHTDLMIHFAGCWQPLDKYFEDGTLPESLLDHVITALDVDGKPYIMGIEAESLYRLPRVRLVSTVYSALGIPGVCDNPDGGAKALAALFEVAAY